MSALVLDELPLSEQIAGEVRRAGRLIAAADALLARFEPPVVLATPSVLASTRPAGGSTFLPTAEHPAMVQESCKFVPIRLCKCIRHARVYRTRGDGRELFFAECAPCEIQTPRLPSMDEAAEAWNKGDVQPIRRTGARAAVAA